MTETPTYDLLITGGTVIDPGAGRHERADVAIAGGKIAVIGLVAMPECGYGRFVDSNAALKCIEENRDLVVGIKVRGSRNAFGEENTAQPVWMAVAAARAAEVPVIMHIGDPPPVLEQGLEILRPGDIVTHAF